MTSEEFKLSDKINDVGHDDDGTPDCDILEVYDIKKFVEKLKEKKLRVVNKESPLFKNYKDVILVEDLDKLTGDLK